MGRTSNSLVNPPPPPLFFRISGLQTFPRQIIERQRFTSKLFIRSHLRTRIALESNVYESVGKGRSYELVIRLRFYPLTTIHYPLTFQRAFPVRTLGASAEHTTTCVLGFRDSAPRRLRASAQVTFAGNYSSFSRLQRTNKLGEDTRPTTGTTRARLGGLSYFVPQGGTRLELSSRPRTLVRAEGSAFLSSLRDSGSLRSFPSAEALG